MSRDRVPLPPTCWAATPQAQGGRSPRSDRPTSGRPLLRVESLAVEFLQTGGAVQVVREVSFELAAGERLALVGESGSGKSVTALSLLRLNLDARYRGRVEFDGRDLLTLEPAALRRVRGREIGLVFQEPMSALNPLFTAGRQVAELIEGHEGLSRAQAMTRATELLALTGIADPVRCVAAYPHELSGGQRQRVVIAMALACQPRLLVADEPTTALDVSVQRQILTLLDSLQRQFGMAVLLITHDLPLVRRFADRVAVMQAGRIVEHGPTAAVFAEPRHAYTRHLLESRPRRMVNALDPGTEMVLRAHALSCHFTLRRQGLARRELQAVKPLELELRRGETLGIVGESGSGKTTLGMSLLRLSRARSEGRIEFLGQAIDGRSRAALRPMRHAMQIVFQDPFHALSPRMTVGRIVAEGLALHRPDLDPQARERAVIEMLEEVGLSADMMERYPHEFSGGQRQRIAVARAAILRPALMLLDEPTSALDVSVQQQVLELLVGLQRKYAMSYLFITHDLAVVRAMSHRLIVMRSGEVVESGETETVFREPRDPYTRSLLAAID